MQGCAYGGVGVQYPYYMQRCRKFGSDVAVDQSVFLTILVLAGQISSISNLSPPPSKDNYLGTCIFALVIAYVKGNTISDTTREKIVTCRTFCLLLASVFVCRER